MMQIVLFVFAIPFPLSPFVGTRFLSSAGVGKSCVLPIRMPNPSPTLDKNLASMGPGILSSIGVGVWRKAPETFPDSNTTLDTFQSAILGLKPLRRFQQLVQDTKTRETPANGKVGQSNT